MSHLWPKAHYVSTFFRADVSDDKVKMNDEHIDYKWISGITDKLHPYLKQMIKEADIFSDNSRARAFSANVIRAV